MRVDVHFFQGPNNGCNTFRVGILVHKVLTSIVTSMSSGSTFIGMGVNEAGCVLDVTWYSLNKGSQGGIHKG